MPIVDDVLIGDGSEGGEFPHSPLPLGVYFETVISNNIKSRGDGPWMTDTSTGRSLTYVELLSAMGIAASVLRRRGLRAGDSVLFVASNHLDVPLIFFAVWKAGGSCACLTLNLGADDIRRRLVENGCKFVVTDADRLERVLDAVAGLEFVRDVFVIGPSQRNCPSTSDLLKDDGDIPEADRPGAGGVDQLEAGQVDLDSMAWLMYSSGTTGSPKGIVHTHRNVTAVIRNYALAMLNGRKVLFINLMINAGGMGVALFSTVGHGHALVMSDLSDDNLLQAIHQHKPQVVSAFPSQIAWLCRHPHLDAYDLTSVNVIVTGGSCLNATYERQIFDKIPNLLVLNIAYGTSETSMVTSNGPSNAEMARLNKESAIARHLIGSCGKLAPYCKLKILEEDTGRKLGAGQVGEVVVQTPYLMRGYLKRPEETAAALRHGWYHTGDKGYFDADGNVFIVGRFKELIKYRMAHVMPSNIEKQVMTHPQVEDVGVIGQPHDVDGELPLAFVVLRPGADVTAQQLVDYTNALVIDEEKLRGGVRFVERIPRNELGKIVRPQLAKLL